MATERLTSDRELDRRAAGAVWDAFLGDLNGLLVLVAASRLRSRRRSRRRRRCRTWGRRSHGWAWCRARRRGRAGAARSGTGHRRPGRGVAAARGPAGPGRRGRPVRALRRRRGAARRRANPPGGARRDRAARDRRLFAPVAVGVLAFAAVLVFLRTGGATAPAAVRTDACNGHVELCSRRLDAALPATHNAMSTAADDWFSSIQTLSIRDQLRAGVRGLLIDAHYGLQAGERGADRPVGALRALGQHGPQALPGDARAGRLEAIQRIRDRVLPGEGDPGVFLCHRFCELGATWRSPAPCARCASSWSSSPPRCW